MSVIVPLYNVADTLLTTLPAVIDQDAAEILLVDDGSTDSTPAIVRELIAGHRSARLIEHGENRGRAAARNTGIAEASGDVLLFLDADMRPERDFVRQHALLHRDPGVIGVVSRAVLEGLDERDPYHRYLRSRRGAAGIGPARPLPFKYFIIGYTSVKADAVRAVGGFDERFTYGEDLDFAARLDRTYPGALFYSDVAVVHHYDHGDLGNRLAKLRAFGRDNLPLLLAKHPGIASEANVDFVDSGHSERSLRAKLQRIALDTRIASIFQRALPYAPRAATNLLLRYIMASTIADAYRSASHRA